MDGGFGTYQSTAKDQELKLSSASRHWIVVRKNAMSFLIFFPLFFKDFYTEDPKSCPDYGRIINNRHFKRVMAMMEDSSVAVGGENDESQCYIGK